MPSSPSHITARATLLFPLIAGLAACGGVGSGVAPESITIEPIFTGGARIQAAATEAFEETGVFGISECLPAGIGVILEFDNGARENISQRSGNVRYTSSNPEVLAVSNLDAAIPGRPNVIFPRGTLLPLAQGEATVTVTFAGLQQSIDVRVDSLGAIDGFTDFPGVIAPGSVVEVRAEALVDGQTRNIASVANLSVEDVNGSDAGPFVRTGTAGQVPFIQGLLPSMSQRATLDFEICDRQLTREFRVAQIQELRTRRGVDDGQPQAIGFSELLEATAIFDDGSEQNLDNQVRFARGEGETSVVALLGTEVGGNNLALGLSGNVGDTPGEAVTGTGGIAMITASFDQNPVNNGAPAAGVPEGATDLPVVEAAPLELPVRPGRVQAIRWNVPTDDNGERVLELPQGCSLQPGVEGDMELLLDDDSRVTVVRRIDRETNYLIGPDVPETDPDAGDSATDGGNNDAPPAAPVISVVASDGISSVLGAGTITAVGEVGDSEILRAVLLQDPNLPGFDDGGVGDGDNIELEDVLTIRVVEGVLDGVDCASLE